VDDPARAIAEMARILKPGGRLVITDLDLHARRELLDEQHDRWPGFAREDVARWLEAAGLDAIAVEACGERCCADSACSASPVAGSPAAVSHVVDSVCCAARAGVSIFLACGRKPLLGVRPCQADADAVGRRARALFDAAPNLLCAESVFRALAEGLGVDSPLVPRVATGFCSGLARTDGLCGAFSGGVLGLGLALGRDTAHDGLDRAYGAVQEFRGVFLERFGHEGCTHICGCRLDTDEGRKAFGPSGAKARCLGVVEWTAAQVVRILHNA